MSKKILINAAVPVLSIVVLLLIWEAIVVGFHVQPYVAPRPLAAIQAVTDNWGTLWPLVLGTLRETAIGYLCGAALGFFFGVIMSRFQLVQRVLYPQLVLSQAIPVIALAFPLTAILGFGSTKPIIAIVVWIVFFPVTVSVLSGLSHVDQDLLNLAKVYGASKWRTFWQIEVPATVTSMFAGLKIAAAYAVTGAIIGQGASPAGSSLDQYQTHANGVFNEAAVYGTTMVMALIGVTFFLAVVGVEVFATPWQRRTVARRFRRRGIARTKSAQ